jgi:RND family efflux transporter MFP subunit
VTRPLAAALVAAIAVTGSGACGRSGDDAGNLTGVVIAVAVQPARLETLRDVARLTGVVAPAATADYTATALEAAIIAEVPDEGQIVAAGQVIVRFEQPAVVAVIAEREIEVTAARLRVGEAQTEADRVGALFAQGLVARNRFEAAQAAVVAAESALAQAGANLETARAQSAGNVIRAPFTGVVHTRFRSPGDVTGRDDPILRLVDPTRLQVVIRLPTEEATRVLPGQAATIRSAASEGLGAVARKSPPDESPVTTEVRLDFAGPTTLLTDMEVQVDVVLDVRANVVVVPAAAVQRPDNAAPFVWIATDEDVARRREVRVGLMANGLTEIVSGLAEGEQVITAGIAELTEGASIQR